MGFIVFGMNMMVGVWSIMGRVCSAHTSFQGRQSEANNNNKVYLGFILG